MGSSLSSSSSLSFSFRKVLIVLVAMFKLSSREEVEGHLLSAPLLFVRHPLNTGEQQLGLIPVFNPD